MMDLNGLETAIKELDQMIAEHEPWAKGCEGKTGPLVESVLKIQESLLNQRKSFMQTYELAKDQFCVECGVNRPENLITDICGPCGQKLDALYP